MEVRIKGMSCGGCVKSVTKIVIKQTGLDENKVSVSLEPPIAKIESTLNDEQLQSLGAALSKAGFELVS